MGFSERKLEDFRDKHTGELCLCCGLGESLKPYVKPIKKEENLITFGVSDINLLFTPTYQCFSEPFKPGTYDGFEDKVDDIYKTRCKNVFSVHPLPFNHTKPIKFPLVDMREEPNIQVLFDAGKIPAVLKSLTSAIGLAIYMGFKYIYVIGFDMYGGRVVHPESNALHCVAKSLPIMNQYLTMMYLQAKDRGQYIYNLNPESLITAFPFYREEK